MTTIKIAALAATAAVAVSGLAPAAGIAKATDAGKYTVTKQTYVYKQAGKIFDGTMVKGETFKVERLSPSGKWAYGMGVRPRQPPRLDRREPADQEEVARDVCRLTASPDAAASARRSGRRPS